LEIHQINFPNGSRGVCEVIAGPDRKIVRTTTHAVGIALLGVQGEEDASTTGDIRWTDYLSTHGLAVGTRGKMTYTLAFVPPKERTVKYTGPLDSVSASRDLVCQFPALMLGVAKEGKLFRKGVVFCLNSAEHKNLNVTLAQSVGSAFPYGNVYSGAGNICWGTVPHTQIQTAGDLEELFFGSEFNGDLYASQGRLQTLAKAYKGKPLPLAAATISIPSMIRSLVGTGA
jgi:hypothetical protein